MYHRMILALKCIIKPCSRPCILFFQSFPYIYSMLIYLESAINLSKTKSKTIDPLKLRVRESFNKII